MSRRVGIVALLHELNTFVDGPTILAHFSQNLLLTGAAVRAQLADAQHEVAGFFAGLAAAGIEAVPLLAARAMPYGLITAETLESLMTLLEVELEKAGPLDGLLVAPHGAAVSQSQPDVDGFWLAAVRRQLGAARPIIGTLDPHANLSPAMVEATDALIAYRTNPHIDQRQRGLEAASLMARTLTGEIKPTQAAVQLPLAINIECQQTDVPPCRPIYDLAAELRQQPGVLSTSLCLGFPYADVAEMGAATIVVTDDDVELARRLASQLAEGWWQARRQFQPRLIGVREAIDSLAGWDGPVCLLDMGDNVGGGSPGDGTILAQALHKARLPDAFVCLYDPTAVEQAAQAGTGGRATLAVGGHCDARHGPPLEAGFTVVGLYEGKFSEDQPRHGGYKDFDQGRTAVVRTDQGLTVMLTSRRMAPFSLRQLTSCQLEPATFKVLVAKGVHAPVAAYRQVCRHMIRVNTPGVTAADLGGFQYHHRRRPMFPFEPDAVWR